MSATFHSAGLACYRVQTRTRSFSGVRDFKFRPTELAPTQDTTELQFGVKFNFSLYADRVKIALKLPQIPILML